MTYQAIKNFRFDRLHSELKYLLNEAHFTRYTQFISSFNRKSTTAGVVVELGHWIRKTDKNGHLKLWTQTYEEFEKMGMDETALSLLSMPRAEVSKYGPTDVSLMQLADNHSQYDPVILTVDGAMWSECEKTHIRVKTVQQIVLEF